MDEERQERNLLTVKEAALVTKQSPFTLRKWVRDQKIQAVRIGRRIYFEPNRLAQWIRTHRT